MYLQVQITHGFGLPLSYSNKYAIILMFLQNAPVAQWIEHWPPEPCAVVRFHSGVPDFMRVLQLAFFN